MGTSQEGLELVYVEQFGRRRWEEHVVLIEEFWQAVRTELDGLDLNYHSVDLYQDGLPVCGKEPEIAREPDGLDAGSSGPATYNGWRPLLPQSSRT